MHLDMRPNRAGNNLFDKGFTHTEHVGKLLALGARGQFPNTKNVRLGKFRAGIRFTRWAMALPVATLGNHVINVVLARAKKQVRWIHARGIVAVMQHPHAVWNGAIVQREGIAMRGGIALIAVESPITKVIHGSQPHPTPRVQYGMNGAVLVNLTPKAFFGSGPLVGSGGVYADKPHGSPLDQSIAPVGSGGNGCRLTATALTKAARVGAEFIASSARVVTLDVPARLALLDVVAAVIAGCYRGFATATALAVTVGDAVFGHRNTSCRMTDHALAEGAGRRQEASKNYSLMQLFRQLTITLSTYQYSTGGLNMEAGNLSWN